MSKRQSRPPKWFEAYVPEEVTNSSIFKFSVKLNNQTIDVNITADTSVDYDAIQTELEDIPSQFIFYAALYSELKQYVTVLERRIKVTRGRIVQTLMDEANKEGVRITDKQLTTLVEADDNLNKLESVLSHYQKHTGKLYFMVEALKMKAECMRSLAGFSKIDYQQSR